MRESSIRASLLAREERRSIGPTPLVSRPLMQARLRSLALALSLAAIAPLAACHGSSDPTSAAEPRTVASMLPKLTRSLTPASAEAAFGKPDETTGSGLLIYVYRAEQGKKVYLGFPGFAPIIYAKAVDASGGQVELALHD